MEYPVKVFDHWVENHSGIEGYVTEINGDCVTIQTLGVTSGPWKKEIISKLGKYNEDMEQFFRWTLPYTNDIRIPVVEEAEGAKLSVLILAAYYAEKTVGAGGGFVWLGSPYDASHACCVSSSGNVDFSYFTSYDYALAPAFSLSKSVLTRDKNGDLRILDETRASERTILEPPLRDSSKATLFGGIADEE